MKLWKIILAMNSVLKEFSTNFNFIMESGTKSKWESSDEERDETRSRKRDSAKPKKKKQKQSNAAVDVTKSETGSIAPATQSASAKSEPPGIQGPQRPSTTDMLSPDALSEEALNAYFSGKALLPPHRQDPAVHLRAKWAALRTEPGQTLPELHQMPPVVSARSVELFEKVGRISEGTFGIVYKARAPNGQLVALKRIRSLEEVHDGESEAMLQEREGGFQVNILVYIRHNLV